MHIATVLTVTAMSHQNFIMFKIKLILLFLTVTRTSLTNGMSFTAVKKPTPISKGQQAVLSLGGTQNVPTTTMQLWRSRNPTAIKNAPVSTCAVTSSRKTKIKP